MTLTGQHYCFMSIDDVQDCKQERIHPNVSQLFILVLFSTLCVCVQFSVSK
jgi:hypothetical protein